MAKKSKFAKAVVALGAIGVASKIAYDKYKNVKDDFVKEETASAEDDVKKYNAIFEKKVVEVEDNCSLASRAAFSESSIYAFRSSTMPMITGKPYFANTKKTTPNTIIIQNINPGSGVNNPIVFKVLKVSGDELTRSLNK